MCGIFGYLGYQDAPGVLLHGLDRLTYRGYDSAGIAVINADQPRNLTKSVTVE